MATCDELATQLSGLQSQLIKLQNKIDNPDEACAEAGLAGDDCNLFIKGLGRQVASVQKYCGDPNQTGFQSAWSAMCIWTRSSAPKL